MGFVADAADVIVIAVDLIQSNLCFDCNISPSFVHVRTLDCGSFIDRVRFALLAHKMIDGHRALASAPLSIELERETQKTNRWLFDGSMRLA